MPNNPSARWLVTITGQRYVMEGYDQYGEYIPGNHSGEQLLFGLYIGNANLAPTFAFEDQPSYKLTSTTTTRSGGNFIAKGDVARAANLGKAQSLYIVYADQSPGGPTAGYSVGVYTVGIDPLSPTISAKVLGSRVYFS